MALKMTEFVFLKTELISKANVPNTFIYRHKQFQLYETPDYDTHGKQMFYITLTDNSWKTQSAIKLFETLFRTSPNCTKMQVSIYDTIRCSKIKKVIENTGLFTIIDSCPKEILLLRKDHHEQNIRSLTNEMCYVASFKTLLSIGTYNDRGMFQAQITLHLYEARDDIFLLTLTKPITFDIKSLDIYFSLKCLVTGAITNGNCRINKLYNYLTCPDNISSKFVTSIHSYESDKQIQLLHAIGVRKHPKTDSYYKEDQEQLRNYCNTLYHYATNAAKKIQCAFKTSISNPSFKLCQDRLLREFDEMANTTI